ncbi:MAG: tyrosine-type recombinase/integrase [Bacteroidota bacterium]
MKVILTMKVKHDRKGPQPVYVLISHGKKAYVSLGLSIDPKHWNPKKREVRATHPEAETLRSLFGERLATARSTAHEVLLTEGRDVQIAAVKKAVVNALHPEHAAPTPAPPILPWLRREVEREYRAMGRIATADAYTSVLNNLEASLHAQGLRPGAVTAKKLTLSVLVEHRNRLARSENDGGEGHSTNYVHKQITTIRALLRRAERARVQGAAAAVDAAERVDVRRERVERPRLALDEVRAYYEMDLSGRAADVRDWWCFAFFAGGLRLSDVCRLRWEHILRDAEGRATAYRIRQKKTRDFVELPLVDEAQAIVERWETRTRPAEAGAGAESATPSIYVFGLLDEGDEDDAARLKKATDRRGALIRKYVRKVCEQQGWQNLGMHGARHSIADAMRKSGVSIYDIASVLGHTKISTTEAYLKGFDSETAGAALRRTLGG